MLETINLIPRQRIFTDLVNEGKLKPEDLMFASIWHVEEKSLSHLE